MATIDDVGRLLSSTAPLYPHYQTPNAADARAMYAAWHLMVGHLPADLLAVAFRDAIAGSKFFPTAADVLASAARMQTPHKRTGIEAYGELQKAIAEHGYYHEPGLLWQFNDPKLVRVVAAFGWPYLCHSEDMMADRAHIIRAYEQMQDNEADQLRELPAVASKRAELAAGRVAETAKRLGGK